MYGDAGANGGARVTIDIATDLKIICTPPHVFGLRYCLCPNYDSLILTLQIHS